jgi:hypothetical protein
MTGFFFEGGWVPAFAGTVGVWGLAARTTRMALARQGGPVRPALAYSPDRPRNTVAHRDPLLSLTSHHVDVS